MSSSTEEDENCVKLLHQAALYGNRELMADLLGGESDYMHEIDALDEFGRTPVHTAAKLKDPECMKLLLEAGAKVNPAASSDFASTPLHVACEAGTLACVRLLVESGADLYAMDHTGHSPLELAQRAGHHRVVKYLMEYIEERDKRLMEAHAQLEKACNSGHMEEAERLLAWLGPEKADVVNAMPMEQHTLLYKACEHGNLEIVQLLLANGADGRIHPVTSYSPLYIAVFAGYEEIVKMLLKAFPDLVSIATVEKYLPIHAAARTGNVGMLSLLLMYGYPHSQFDMYTDPTDAWHYQLPFDVNARDADDRTPLFLATMHNHSEAVRFLLGFTVPCWPRGTRTSRSTPPAEGPFEVYEEVFSTPQFNPNDEPPESPTEIRSNIDSPLTPTGFAPEMICSRVELNVGKSDGPSINSGGRGSTKRTCPIMLDIPDCRGRTPLHEAIIQNYFELVDILLERKANVNAPLIPTELELQRFQNTMDSVSLILASGSSALAEACRLENETLVSMLLAKGAVDTDHRALSVCLLKGNESIASDLLKKNVYLDPEWRVNKKSLDIDVQQHFAKGRAVIPSSLFPAYPVMLNWHNLSLPVVRESWLSSAAMSLNVKLKASTSSLILWSAITRIDISKNDLSELPICIFQMVSLRVLNVAHNKIERLPVPGHIGNASSAGQATNSRLGGSHSSSVLTPSGVHISPARTRTHDLTWNVPVLEEIHLQNNRLECLPEMLFHLPNLQGLDVSNNKLASLPYDIWLAPKLKDFNAAFNLLRQLPLHRALNGVGRSASIQDSQLTGQAVDLDYPASLPVGAACGLGTSDENFNRSPSISVQSSEIGVSVGESEGGSNSGDSVGDLRFFNKDDTVSFQPLKRHNLWQKSAEMNPSYVIHEEDIDATKRGRSCLTSLNLSHNQFESLSDGLPCLASNLGRLNISCNLLREIGPVHCYPARLKHLDLSQNKILFWFSEPSPSSSSDCGYCCAVGFGGGRETPGGVVTRPHSPVMGRRSQSVVRGNRSLSVARGDSISPIVPSFCIHRRHVRLENLRTLVLANNRLDYICLRLEDGAGLHGPPAVPRRPVSGASEKGSDRGASRNRRPNSRRTPSDSSAPGSGPGLAIRKGSRGSISSTASAELTPAAKLQRSKNPFPSLSMLDVSCNNLALVPSEISELSSLSVLNLSHNKKLSYLPSEMGLLSKLWNLNLTGCSLGEPLKSMIDSKKYKTLDIVGYLKSILEDSKPYARLKLMIVGVQGIGKTSLLEQLRQEGTYKKNQADGWAKRMGHKDINRKTARGVNISTVGVDVGDWTYEPKKTKTQPVHGSVTFRTWDFGGQREYYATHQYFLSKRSLYLVCWRVTDGEAGISEITQWLVNIQARAPNSPVIIVGTHFDEILNNRKKFPEAYVEDLQQMIKERFVAIQDADKKGLPRVVDSVIVSCKTRFNVRVLCNLVYNTAHELRCSGTKERLLEQKIPATYLNLEEVVCEIAAERKELGKDPVLSLDQYRNLVQGKMQERFKRKFRDFAELNQATAFLHENGVLLHYEDATLKDLYFLDPQWLCDILANVITIREINPFAKNGLMKTDDLKLLFKSSRFAPSNIRAYILNLLQKFEVALTWDNRTLLIPSLLPDEYQLRGGYRDCEVKIPIKSKGWLAKARTFVPKQVNMEPSPLTGPSFQSSPSISDLDSQSSSMEGDSLKLQLKMKLEAPPKESKPEARCIPIFSMTRPKKPAPSDVEQDFCINARPGDEGCIRRLYLMSYFPSGFWSRLITRLLGDEFVPVVMQHYFRVSANLKSDLKLAKILETTPEWLLWQTGMEIKFLGHTLFSLKEFLPLAEIRDVNYKDMKFKYQLDGNWSLLNAENMSVMEIYMPSLLMTLKYEDSGGLSKVVMLQTDYQLMTRLLSITVELIDTLLEDWYPSLGTRFVHTAEGKFLVTRLVPCPYCLTLFAAKAGEGHYQIGGDVDHTWTILSAGAAEQQESELGSMSRSKTFDTSIVEGGKRRQPSNSSQDSGVTVENVDGNRCNSMHELAIPGLGPSLSLDESVALLKRPADNAGYSFTIEECILAAHQATVPKCPLHGLLSLHTIAPDVVLLDLGEQYLILPEQVKRGKMLGRGAFGFVFKASVKFRGYSHFTDVAMKMLQPVDPGFGARQSAVTAYKAAWSKWQRDPTQYACRAYCTARQELNVLTSLKHPHVVYLVGVCPRPLALVISLAPLGSLNNLLSNYRRSGARLHVTVLQETAAQVARAMEYLHEERIIYRDLKSENVLVWQFPPPFSHLTNVDVKLGDYGISRSMLPAGGTKGFGGTEGFMAPEIMLHNGEEEYTEKVDCFSFGIFLYELFSLKLPFEGQEQVKEFILDGGRPILSPREMLYPSNMLDLMIVSWAHTPQDRPTSSQLVSITTAPEFSHLLDVVSINDSDAAVLTGEAFSFDDCMSMVSDDGGSVCFEGEVWLSRADGQVSVLACNQYGWLDYKSLNVNEDSFVTALCLVEDTMWLGELTGIVRVFCAKTYSELWSFSLAPHILPHGNRSPEQLVSLPVAEIIYISRLGRVLIAAGQSGVLALCHAKSAQGCDPVITTYSPACGDVHCITVLPASLPSQSFPAKFKSYMKKLSAAITEEDEKVEAWCGGPAGKISILQLSDELIKEVICLNHYSPPVEGVEVYRLCSSVNSDAYVWSYVYPGCILYQWSTSQRAIIAKLDCSKIVPCSESINTINIDERLSPGKCQVTSVCLIERDETAQLCIGTTWGVVIIAEADQLRPVTAFRPHIEEVRVIVPVGCQKKSIGANSSSVGRISSQGSAVNMPHSTDSGRGGSRTSPIPGAGGHPKSNSTHNSSNNSNGLFLITVGKGYRNLIQRYLENYREEQTILESRNKDFFAVVWRTDDWSGV